MIFVTVGTQLPFERLLETVDAWAAEHPDQEVFAQVGQTKYKPSHFRTTISMSPTDYDDWLSRADIIIGHVGMGTIISGVKHAKPLVLMPRHAAKGEHRNDHQLATAKQFGTLPTVNIVDSNEDFFAVMETLLKRNEHDEAVKLEVSSGLVNRIQDFLKKDFDGHDCTNGNKAS